MAQIINGVEISNEFCKVIGERVAEIKSRGIFPKLAVIRVGENDRERLYLQKQKQVAENVGIEIADYHFDDSVKQENLINLINDLNNDNKVHAIFLQSALPKRLSFRDVVNAINVEKDVDGLTTLSQGRLFLGEPGVIPCTPLSVLHLLRIVHKDITGMHAVVLGRSSTVGRPLSQLLLNANCTVTLLHSYSHNLEKICREADILITAVGKPKFVDGSFIKPGATVIDVGFNRITDGFSDSKLVGDIDIDSVKNEAGAITPVPGGVGPLTVAYLMHNTLKLACCY